MFLLVTHKETRKTVRTVRKSQFETTQNKCSIINYASQKTSTKETQFEKDRKEKESVLL